MSTAKEIYDSLSRSILDSPVSDIHLSEISSHITEWQVLAPYLDISDVDEEDIITRNHNHPELQRREALRKWREANGSKATYRKLICILCCKGRVRTAEILRDMARKTSVAYSDSHVLSDIQKYFRECYTTEMPHPSQLQWPFFSNVSFFELDLHDAPVLTNSMAMHGEEQSAKPLPLKAIFTAGKKNVRRKVILVEGVAGSGKSTLCWFACKEWAEGRLFEDIELIIHVSLSEKAIQSATKLADIIPHHSKEMREAVAKAIADKHGKGICFLFDGCDETPLLFSRGSFLTRLIAGTGNRSMLTSANILLTSRPSGIPFDLLNSVTGKVVIKGFKSLDYFIDTTISEDSVKKAQLFEALEMKPELYSLCHIPLHAVILVHLFDFFKDSLPTTRTELFHPLVCNFLIRHMQTRTEFETQQVKNLSSDLPPAIHASLCNVSKLAYQSIVKRETAITPEMLKAAGIDPLKLLDDTFGLLQVQHKIAMYGPTNTCTFPHLSLQEFLAALHISQLSKDDQFHAFENIFKQNPLSSVLSFYAGLTQLHSEKISKLLCCVLDKRFDITSIKTALQSTGVDIRQQILALMNCVYESKNMAVINRIRFRPEDAKDDVVRSTDIALFSSFSCIQIPLPLVQFHPTECLAVGFFIRHTCQRVQKPTIVIFDLSSCLLRTREIKALAQELGKPMRKQSLALKMMFVRLTNDALRIIRKLISSQPGLWGLILTGCMIDDIQLAFKYFIEELNNSCIHQLSVTQILASQQPVTHHLVLLLNYCQQLKDLNLSGSKAVFRNPSVMPLFCEALKHSRIVRLFLDSCDIDDEKLQYLASAITGGCLLEALDIGWNPYTSHGLTCFLNTLIGKAWRTFIIALSTNEVLCQEHLSLVKQFNSKRKKCLPFFEYDLGIGCKNNNWQVEANSLISLIRNLQFVTRN